LHQFDKKALFVKTCPAFTCRRFVGIALTGQGLIAVHDHKIERVNIEGLKAMLSIDF
jgi:hypothetical protein